MGAKALHGIRMNVASLELATQFYTSIGMIEDIGMRRAEGDKVSVLPDGEPAGDPSAASIALRWPCDPYMHLTLVGVTDASPRSGWPKAPNQVGSTVLTLLVGDVDAECQRVSGNGAEVVTPPTGTHRLQGETRSAFVKDPDGNVVELYAANPTRAWDNSHASVYGADRTFLHFELNTDNLEKVSAFYEGFGFAHNPLNNMRANATIDPMPGEDPYITSWGQALMPHMAGVNFLRLPDDPSEMHLEIMGWSSGLIDPTDQPVWHQRGVMRYCFKDRGLNRTLADMKRRGVKIFMHDQKAGLAWGDSEWFYFADPDDNILTFEEWFPTGHWGERY